MSSRARRVADAPVQPFDWAGRPGVRPASAPPSAPGPAPAADGAADPPRLDAIERDAFMKGYAQGESAGQEAAARRADAMLRRLTHTLDELTGLRAEMIRRTERQMIQLALAIARRVIHREVSLDQDLLIAMSRVALDRLGENASATVRLNPQDFAATVGAPGAAPMNGQVRVVADAAVSRGACRVESDFGFVDAGVDAQLQEIGRALLGDEDGSMAAEPARAGAEELVAVRASRPPA